MRVKKSALLASTTVVGLAALLSLAATPTYAQSGAQAATPTRPTDQPAPDPAVVQPNSDDQAEVRPEVTAATQQAAEDEAAVEGVIVTGSRIRRDPTTAPTPLQQFTRQEIIESGSPNIVDFLADIPALAGSQVPEDTTGGVLGTGGLSLLNLRFLGTERTLVLIDGRRHPGAAYSASSAVDVDTIPRLMIESVEVLTGASSSVYGADAVSGVVNFILRKNFEGIELDAGLTQLNQDDNKFGARIAGLVGKNLFDGRLNVYAHAEYDRSDEVFNRDIDWFAESCQLIQTDLDPAAGTPDGVVDADVVCGLQNAAFPLGGSLTLANLHQPSPTSDPDLPVLNPATVCATPALNVNLNTQCFNANPGATFGFTGVGGSRFPVDFGTYRQPASTTGARNLVQGSSTARLPLELGNLSRLPKQEAYRFQTGFNFDVTEWLQAFGEIKYVKENNFFRGSSPGPTIGIRAQPANRPTELTGTGTSNFNIGLDNAYLPAETLAAILANRRNVYGPPTATGPGPVTGTVPDQRALYRSNLNELSLRFQENDRETERFVIGLRGDVDRLWFLKDFSYELGYTYGETADNNLEGDALDSERYAFAADAVVDTAGVLGAPGQIVCRVKLLAAQGVAIPMYVDIAANKPAAQRRNYAPNAEAIQQCTPINIFGSEGALTEAQQDYVFTYQERGFRITQEDVLGFASANLWDFWGAGPIGVAGGFEYRKDTYGGHIGNEPDRFDRVLFANVYLATPEQGTSVKEAFGEVRLPLLRDLPFVESLEVSGSYRISDYEISGRSDTYSVQGQWRLSRDIGFRATHGKAIRAPALNQLFRAAAQTFVAISDNCSQDIINTTVDPVVKANRIANCAAAGVPTTFQDPVDGNEPGFNGSNPLLNPEKALTTTFSVLLTPRFIPGFSLVVDVYDIQFRQAIESVGVNAAVDLCYDGPSLNQFACNVFTRDPTTFEIISFNQGPLNFAGIRNRGIDINARYRTDLGQLLNRDLGQLTFTLRGNYLLRDQSFTDPFDPTAATNFDSALGEPRVRFRLGTNYTQGRFGVTWDWDWISSMEINDEIVLVNDADIRPAYLLKTPSFSQHDVTIRYDLNDQIRLRAGVVNLFDAEPPLAGRQAAGGESNDLFDYFGTRFFVGVNFRR